MRRISPVRSEIWIWPPNVKSALPSKQRQSGKCRKNSKRADDESCKGLDPYLHTCWTGATPRQSTLCSHRRSFCLAAEGVLNCLSRNNYCWHQTLTLPDKPPPSPRSNKQRITIEELAWSYQFQSGRQFESSQIRTPIGRRRNCENRFLIARTKSSWRTVPVVDALLNTFVSAQSRKSCSTSRKTQRKSSTPRRRPHHCLQWHVADTEGRRRRLRPEHLLRPRPHQLGHRRQQPKSGVQDPIRSSSSTTASLHLSDRTLVYKGGGVWRGLQPRHQTTRYRAG